MCCEEPPQRLSWYTSDGARLLWWSLGTAQQVERLGDWAVLGQGEWRPSVLHTLLDGLIETVRGARRPEAPEGQAADDRGLTMDQLGDRIVPDFGLDADGGMTLDYGPGRFRRALEAGGVRRPP